MEIVIGTLAIWWLESFVEIFIGTLAIWWLGSFVIAVILGRGKQFATCSWDVLTDSVRWIVGGLTSPLMMIWNRYSGLLFGLVVGLAVGTVYGPVLCQLTRRLMNYLGY